MVPFCSPIGEVFRSRLRQFPSLVNCCTIDWFSEWPDEALCSVASSFMQDITEIDITDTVKGLVCLTVSRSIWQSIGYSGHPVPQGVEGTLSLEGLRDRMQCSWLEFSVYGVYTDEEC